MENYFEIALSLAKFIILYECLVILEIWRYTILDKEKYSSLWRRLPMFNLGIFWYVSLLGFIWCRLVIPFDHIYLWGEMIFVAPFGLITILVACTNIKFGEIYKMRRYGQTDELMKPQTKYLYVLNSKNEWVYEPALYLIVVYFVVVSLLFYALSFLEN